MQDNNGIGEVYGFCYNRGIVTNDQIRCNLFCSNTELVVLFNGIEEEKQGWIDKYLSVVECMAVALAKWRDCEEYIASVDA